MKIMTAACILGLSLPTLASGFCKEAKAGLKARAKVSCEDARKTALARLGQGNFKVKSSELEEEKGKLVWSFDVKAKGKPGIEEVQVDALNGEVVSVEHEDARTEAREKEHEKEEKAKKNQRDRKQD